MSITFNGSSQYAHHAAAPSASAFAVGVWWRRDSDSGADEDIWRIGDGSGPFNQTMLRINNLDQHQGTHVFSSTAPALNPVVTSTWYWSMLLFDGSEVRVRHVEDGGTAWASNNNITGMSAAAPTEMAIGAQTSTGGNLFPGTIALMKIWSGTLPTDTELLAERLNANATVTTGLWARYVFDTAALDADSSGNSRTLTLVGTPTFTADKPTDLTVGGGVTPPPNTSVLTIPVL